MSADTSDNGKAGMDNLGIAKVLSEVADLLEIQGANPFRIRAYRRAARTVEELSEPVAHMLDDGDDLTELEGIGKEMASHLGELARHGRLELLDRLTSQIPYSLIDLMRIPGIGPKKTGKLWESLGIETVEELEAAATEGKVAELSGFGAKSQERILQAIDELRSHGDRFLLSEIDHHLSTFLPRLREIPGVQSLEVAGSYRRRKETVGDADLLIIADDSGPVMKTFTEAPEVARVELHGDTRSSVVLRSGLEVDLRVVPEENHGAALLYFTGSKEHTVKLRKRAVARDLKLTEYSLTDEDGKVLAGETEEGVYAALDLEWIPPELREDRGEIEAAAEGRLPDLVRREDIQGELHMHSTWSDGRNTLEEMVQACEDLGYAYCAITDHSKALAMTGGLDAKRLRKQWDEVAEIQDRHPDIRILRGQEVDILADGTLDLEDDMLEQLDIVLVSVHSRFDLPEAQQTERILEALRHPQTNILCHPTARVLNRRKPIALALDEILACAGEHQVAVELNSSPSRLDLKDTHLMRARELGLRIAINTDAHRTTHLANRAYGIDQARRAWVGKGEVLNALGLEELVGVLGKEG